jgi:hypothetical protein
VVNADNYFGHFIDFGNKKCSPGSFGLDIIQGKYVKPKRHCDSRYSIKSDKEALFVVAKQLMFITKR